MYRGPDLREIAPAPVDELRVALASVVRGVLRSAERMECGQRSIASRSGAVANRLLRPESAEQGTDETLTLQ